MKGDFTRDTFDPARHYHGVLMQQGRVQLDADWNEQTSIALRRDETTASDLIGDCGGFGENAGFGITAISGTSNDFDLTAGRYYVDGIQCELEEPGIRFSQQPDRRRPVSLVAGRHLIYLEVWRRHITALEQPSLRESALGGPDTGTRLKTVWQVRAVPHPDPVPATVPTDVALCVAGNVRYGRLIAPSTGELAARTVPVQDDDDPCILPESAGYTGLENQLYRVEIHRGSFDALGNLTTPTWKWSRENGSVLTGLKRIAGAVLTVASLGQDEHLGFRKGSFVEIIDDAIELEGEPGQILEVTDVNPDNLTLTLASNPTLLATGASFPDGVDPALNPRIRRWEGAIANVSDADWIKLEAGIEIRFKSAISPTVFRNGDYWQIPARAAAPDAPAGDIEWPRDLTNGQPDPTKPLFIGERGISHHFCKLGVVNVPATGTLTVLTDCRCIFPALTQIPRLFYISGDGQEVMPLAGAPWAVGSLFKLPFPLIVGIGNGHCNLAHLKVRFRVTVGAGSLRTIPPETAVTAPTIIVAVRADGQSKIEFLLDGTNHNQQVTATLLDLNDKELSLPIIFNANLSIASQVGYNPGNCTTLANNRTVQDAISRLATLASIYAVSGDGQQAAPNTQIPIRVRVASRCGPVPGVTVTFNPSAAVTPLPPATDFVTDANGETAGLWRLASSPVIQTLQAQIAGDTTTDPRRVTFIAHLTTEQSDDPDPVRVVGLRVGKPTRILRNGMSISINDLVAGLFILCDKIVDGGTINDPVPPSNVDQVFRGQPTCFLTIEVPYPLTGQERSMWDLGTMVGYRPIILHAFVNASPVDNQIEPPLPPGLDAKGVINWQIAPGDPVNFLSRIFGFLSNSTPRLDKVLLRLTLKGNFIWSTEAAKTFPENPAGFLDGEAFRAPDGVGESELILPSGDRRRGGDFEIWFWLRQNPVLVITTQPADRAVLAGQPAPFAVVATGTPPITFQWQRNGVNIAGQIAATFVIPNTTLADNGSRIRVVVRDGTGAQIASRDASLTVTQGPIGGIPGGGIVVQPGGGIVPRRRGRRG